MSRVLEDEARDLPGAASTHEPGRSAEGDRPSARLLSLCLLGAVGAFAVVGIGWPLVGVGVFAPTDLLANWSPYTETVLAGVVPDNVFLQDVADGVIPQTDLFVDLFVNGSGSAWNPYLLGGVPLGAVPNNAVFNPLSLPFYLLPTWLAPAWVKVAEIAVSVGGTFLFARRLGLGRSAAAIGGLAFATSAFLLAWTGWPQTRTAAFIPVLFWAVERLATRRRPTDGVLVAAAAAAMLLGGFPAVTGYALLTAGIYLAVRLGALYPGQWRRLARVAAAGVAAVAGAFGLAAFQVLPFAGFMSEAYVWGREQTSADHLPFQALVTAIAPNALGDTYAGTNIVELLSYVGAAVLLLAVAGVAEGRALLPRGVWAFLVTSAGVAVVLVYAGGAPLAVAQRLPVLFADNFVGRFRSVLGLLVAVLAAVGFEVVARRHRAGHQAGGRAGGRLWSRAVWVVAGVDGIVVVSAARPEASLTDMLVGLAFLAAAGGCLALAWWGRRRIALAGVPLLVAAQALVFVVPYWAHADRETFYPTTPVHEFLAGNLGADRYASPTDTLLPGESSVHRLRALTGHGFADRRMGELIEALPGRQFRDPPTLPSTVPSAPVVGSPILDRLSVRYFVASASSPVIGTPGASITGPLRAVTVELPAPVRRPTPLRVSLRDATGAEVASGVRTVTPTDPMTVHVPVAGENLPEGTPLTSIATEGAVTGAIAAADDGLRVVMAEPSVIYERERALPRIRWAGTAVVEPDPDRRLAMLASGDLGQDEVLLDSRAGTSSGATAMVEVVEDGTEAVEVTVAADGAGYLVVADALRNGWEATVDGAPAEILAADHALVAVPVDIGRHTVRLTYTTPYHGAGTWLSAATGALLCALVIVERFSRRKRYASTHPDVELGTRD
jgi:Bacterial membrane protein YfhO